MAAILLVFPTKTLKIILRDILKTGQKNCYSKAPSLSDCASQAGQPLRQLTEGIIK